MAESFTNFANTTLSSTITSGTTSIAVADGSSFPTSNFYIVIDWNNASHEVIHISSRSSNTLTADVRGAQGSTAAAHTSGARVIHGWLAHHATEDKKSNGADGIFMPEGSLVNWKAARATAGASLVPIVIWGDSLGAGYYSSNLITKGWFGKLVTDLKTAYGDGGSGFLSIGQGDFGAGFSTNGASFTAGTWTVDTASAGMNEINVYSTTIGHQITFTNVKGTSIDIYYGKWVGGGSFTYNIDAAGPVTVSTNAAANSAGVTTVTGLSASAHTVVITISTAAYVFFMGITGRNATGIVGHNMSYAGRASVAGNNATFNSQAVASSGTVSITNMSPRLGIIAMGLNDINIATTADAYATNIAKRCEDFKAYSSGVCDLILVTDHKGTINADTNKLYPKYASAMIDLARTYGAVWINRWAWGRNSWDYWNGLGYWGTAGNTGAAGTDVVHLNDLSHAAVATPIYDLLTAP